MLSIGKLGIGQQGYYLEQAQGSLTRVRAVSSGVEDYYLSGPEAPGMWVGRGAAALSLAGKVRAQPLDRVLAGQHPTSGEPLGRVLKDRVPGFDLAYSAPKSVSVLFGIGDDQIRSVIRAAHDRAVLDAVGYVERQAAVARRGAGGAVAIRGNGLIGAAFRHRTSRAGDPQLHTHVLVANLVLGADGQWSTLDARRIYAHAKTAGYLYEARLRSELTRELGVEWTAVRNGIADIAGVPPAVLRAFSRRRAEIAAELERRGASSAAAAQVATLHTRRAKNYRVTPEQLVPEWRERAAGLGLTWEVIRDLGERTPSKALRDVDVEAIADRLAGPHGLTERRSTFTRRDVLQAWCELLPPGVDLTLAGIEELADAFLRSQRVVVLAEGERPASLRRRDGRLIPPAGVERIYSTPELLALERRIIEHAVERRAARAGLATSRAVERAIERRPSLAGEQIEMVRRLTRDGDGVAVIVGQAGAGKTFALSAAREAWEASGRRVYGVALARRAANELQESAGIPSTSLTALLQDLARRPLSTVEPRSVLVVDEASMVPTRELARLVDHVRRLDIKLVLVGDHRQLPAIGAGGAIRGLLTRLPVIELQENRRQEAQWERDALRLVRDGAAREAVQRYDDAGRIQLGADAGELRQRMVADWWAQRDPDRSLMIAQRRVDVADLNGRAHALMRAAGALGTEELCVCDATFSVGDRIVLRRNDRRRGVVNGDRGVVVAVAPDDGRIDVQLGGRTVSLTSEYLVSRTRHGTPALIHGYAITGHLAQGMTCRRTFVLATDTLTREAAYVALSRGRESNRIYALEPATAERDEYAPTAAREKGARAALVAAFGRSGAQTLASDVARPAQLMAALAEVRRERIELAQHRRNTHNELGQLERHRPQRYRRALRAEHAAAVGRVTATLQRTDRALLALDSRDTELRQQLARERAVSQPEHSRAVPMRGAGRGMELGL